MPSFHKHLKVFPAVFFVFLILVGSSLLFFVKPGPIEKKLESSLEEFFNAQIDWEGFHFRYFPHLGAQIERFSLVTEREWRMNFKGENVRVSLSFFALLFGKIRVTEVESGKGEWSLDLPGDELIEPLTLNPLHIKLQSGFMRGPVRLKLEGAFGDVPRSVEADLKIRIKEGARWDWSQTSIDGRVDLNRLLLFELTRRLKRSLPVKLTEGQVSSSLKIQKKKGDPYLNVWGVLHFEQLIYQSLDEMNKFKSPAVAADLDLDLSWDPLKEDLVLNRVIFVTPVGKFEAVGYLLLKTGELRNVRLTATDVAVESIPQYSFFFNQALPFNLGFSGTSKMELFLEGTWDHLSIHANWDLASTLLTYSRYFSKPKDVPTDIRFDFILKDGRVLSGDFSLRLKEAALKGTLTDFKIPTSEGLVNIITNKFPLEGWEPLLPPLQDFTLEGDMKILVNAEGQLQGKGSSKGIVNLTLENGYIRRKDGLEIQKVHVIFDYGPVAMQFKKLDFEIGEASIASDFVFYNFFANPTMKGKLESPRLKPGQAAAVLEMTADRWLSDPQKKLIRDLGRHVRFLFPEEEEVSNFRTTMAYEAGKFSFPSLEFSAYEGDGKFQIEIDHGGDPVRFWVNADVRKMSLAKFLRRAGGEARPVNGNLFLDFQLSGFGLEPEKIEERMVAEGVFSITNGEFLTFDVLDTVGEIEGFEALRPFVSGKTSFHDLRGMFHYRNAKMVMKEATLFSPDLLVEAGGEAFPDGRLNYALKAYLSPTLTGHLLKPIWGNSGFFGDKQFGPVHLLLSGPVLQPELKPDATLLLQLQEDLGKKKSQKVLRNFMPEEALFGEDREAARFDRESPPAA